MQPNESAGKYSPAAFRGTDCKPNCYSADIRCKARPAASEPSDGDAKRLVPDGGSIVEDDLPSYLTAEQGPFGPRLRCECGGHGTTESTIEHASTCEYEPTEPEVVADGGYPQPEIGDLVTFVDSDGNETRGIVVDGAPNDHYVSLVTSEQGEFGTDYTWSVTTHTSVYPHYTVWPEGEHATHAFKPGWDA